MILALFSAPSFATYNNGGGQLVAAHEAMVADAYVNVAEGHAGDSVDNLVELCNSYANQRQVVLNVHHNNAAQVVRFVQVNRRVAARKNVRVVFVQNRRVAFQRNQVQLVVRAGRRGIFNGRFFSGFGRNASVRASRAIGVRVRF